MTCDDVTPALLAWQLGACESPEREAIDAHLSTCAACLSRFLATKRISEDAAAFDERPAPAVRARLRARVSKRARRPELLVAPPWPRSSLRSGPGWSGVSPDQRRSVRRWMVALAAAALLLGFVGWRAVTPAPLSPPPAAAGHGLVDADGPANLDVL